MLTDMKTLSEKLVLGWDTGAIHSLMKRSTPNHSIAKAAHVFTTKNRCAFTNSNDILSTTTGSYLPRTWFKQEDVPLVAPFLGLVGSNFYAKHLVALTVRSNIASHQTMPRVTQKSLPN